MRRARAFPLIPIVKVGLATPISSEVAPRKSLVNMEGFYKKRSMLSPSHTG